MNNFIQVQVTADISGLQNGLNQAQQAVNNAVNKMRSSLAGLGSAFSNLNTSFDNVGTQAKNTSTSFNTLTNSITKTTTTQNNFNNASNNTVGATGTATSGVLGLTRAFLGLAAAKQAIDYIMNANKELMKTSNSFRGLEAIANASGISMASVMKLVGESSRDGLMTSAEAMQTLKLILGRGLNIDQAEKWIKAHKDIAAVSRQGHYETVGKAIVVAAEGLKNGNSVLYDATGITKNLAKSWDDYAKVLGKTTEQLTDTEKIHAEMIDTIKEGQAFLGQSSVAAQGMQGAYSNLSIASTNLKETIAEALGPAIALIINIFSDWMNAFNLLIRLIKVFTVSITYAIQFLAGFLELLATRNWTKFKDNMTQNTQALIEFNEEVLKTKGANFDPSGKKGPVIPKDDTNAQAKYIEEKVAFDKKMALVEAEQKNVEQSFKNQLDALKQQKDKGLIIHEAYVNKAKEIESKLIDSQSGVINARIEGLKKLLGFAVGNDKNKIEIDISKQQGDVIANETKKDGLQFKSYGGGGGSSNVVTKQQIADAINKVNKAQLEAEFDLLRSGNKAKLNIYENDFNNKKMTAEKYYSLLAQLEETEAQKRLEITKKDIENLSKSKPKNKVEQANKEAELIKLNTELKLIEDEKNQSLQKNAIELENINNKYREKIRLNQLESNQENGNTSLELAKIQYEQEYALGKVNNLDMLNLDIQLEQSRFELAKEFYEAKKGMYAGDVEAMADINKEIETAELEHVKRMAQLNKDLVLEKKKDYIEMFGTVKQAGTSFLADFAKNPRDFKESMMDALNTISDKLVQMAAEKYMDKIMATDGMGSFMNSLSSGSGGGGGLGSLLSSGLGAISQFIPGFATGTNYIPQDMLAVVHKGEAVVPARYNNAETFGGGGGNNVSVNNKFILSQTPDKRTQAQIAAMAGASIQNAVKRNS